MKTRLSKKRNGAQIKDLKPRKAVTGGLMGTRLGTRSAVITGF